MAQTESRTVNCNTDKRDQRNSLVLTAWIFAWSLSWVGVKYGIKDGWWAAGIPAATVILGNAAIGLGMILSFRKFLNESDELQRKIQLDALALAFGIGLVAGVAFQLIETAQVIPQNDISYFILFSSLSYAAAVIFGRRRYV